MKDLQYQVGVAKIDITPNYPIRLSGYGARHEETSEISQRIYAKSLAISHQDDDPFVMILVENDEVQLIGDITNKYNHLMNASSVELDVSITSNTELSALPP